MSGNKSHTDSNFTFAPLPDAITKGYITVYMAAYQNKIVRVQAADGTVLYQSAMTQNTLVIDARKFSPDYALAILNK